jgi:hypothetical protein
LASLKYRQYSIEEESFEWIIKKRYTLPLPVLRLLLFLVPEAIFRYFLRDFSGKVEGITVKQSLWILYQILKEIAESKSIYQNEVVYESRKENLIYIILVE